MSSAERRRAAVLGSPVSHSLSPALHRAGYAANGLTGWTYEAIECDAAALPALVAGLGPEWAGLSVTMPGKFAAVSDRLMHLKKLGVNAIQIMPVGEFAGERSFWLFPPAPPYPPPPPVEFAYFPPPVPFPAAGGYPPGGRIRPCCARRRSPNSVRPGW